MKNFKTIFFIAITVSFLLFSESCKKDEASEFENAEYSVSTGEVTGVNGNFALVSGKLRMESGSVKSYGHCWSTYQGPTIESDSYSDFGAENSTREFISEMTDLKPGTIYYVRTYAKGKEVVYGNEIPVRTPDFSVGEVKLFEEGVGGVRIKSHIDLYSGMIGKYGFCWSEQNPPTIHDNKKEFTNLSQTKDFFHTIHDLKLNTNYYFRAWAESDQLAYGPVVKLYVDNVFIGNTEVKQISPSTVEVQTYVSFTGITVLNSGFCWSKSTTPTVADNKIDLGALSGPGNLSTTISEFEEDEIFNMRAFIQTEDTLYYSEVVSYQMLPLEFGFSGPGRTFAVTIYQNERIFVGLGRRNQDLQDLWEYDVQQDTWSQRAEFPADYYSKANSLGYVFDYDENTKTRTGDSEWRYYGIVGWRYDAGSDSWIDLPKLSFNDMVWIADVFEINGRSFITVLIGFDDFKIIEHDRINNSWIEVDEFSDFTHEYAFTINNKHYFLYTNDNSYSTVNKLKTYDLDNKTWNDVIDVDFIDDYPYVDFFTYNNRGYIVMDDDGSIWEFNPEALSWRKVQDVPHDLSYPAILSLGENIYFGLGEFQNGNYNSKFYLYRP